MSGKMKRTQIYLEPELDEDLSCLAARRGVSKAQLLREGAYMIVREEMAAEEDPLLGIIGLGHSETGRVSEEHDQFLMALPFNSLAATVLTSRTERCDVTKISSAVLPAMSSFTTSDPISDL